MISAVVLNWKRPDNVERIANSWPALVNDAIVWNNNPWCNSSLSTLPKFCRLITSPDCGLYSRFSAASLARNECVLMQDDDLLLPERSIQTLVSAWLSAPMLIHGVFGRKPKVDGSYAISLTGEHSCPIVLTRALVMHRSLAAYFFLLAERLQEVQKTSEPQGNGEDIILSYAAKWLSGQDNRIHAVEVKELPSPHAINKRVKDHHQHRTNVMQACIKEIKNGAR